MAFVDNKKVNFFDLNEDIVTGLMTWIRFLCNISIIYWCTHISMHSFINSFKIDG